MAQRVCALIAASALFAAGCAGFGAQRGAATADEPATISLVTVNHPQMQDIRALAHHFHEEHPDIRVDFIVLPESQMRDRVTQDAATQGGLFDIITLGTYEAPLFAELG